MKAHRPITAAPLSLVEPNPVALRAAILVAVRPEGVAQKGQARAVLRTSSDGDRFEPKQAAVWREGVERFAKFRSRVSN